MSTKRVDERNEKIIRGLMKLPPNRRCINCNNLGPQYVCTNFWTFVCTACSGIHREFTHRVKSVSMAKFTSEEVEALQKGGNQRARETYLVHWEPQRQRQPNSSNVDKVREFIKHVYVDKKYIAGIASDKPPGETLNLRNPEEETRRASSYHSYSQSPPYDYQYEERRYGKQLPALTRKPGSDRGLYEGKVSTFSSPSRLSDQALEQPRASDYSVYSPSQSPNFERDGRVKSPPYQATDIIAKENTEGFRRTQRATSSGSFGSFDSNSMSFKSNNSATSPDLVSAPVQSFETVQDKHANSSLLQSSASGNFGGLDLFDSPFAPQNVTSSPAVDQFQLPEAQPKASIDLFEPPSTSSVPTVLAQKPSETAPSSSNNFSQMPQQPPPVVPKNEGWAMFDFPQHTPPNPDFVHSTPLGAFPNKGYIEKVDDALPVSSSGHQWSVFEGNNAHEPAPVHKPIHNVAAVHSVPPSVLPRGAYIEKVDAFPMPSTGQQWPAFEGSNALEPAAIHTPIHNTGVVHSGPPGGLPNGGYIEKVDAFPVPSTGQQWPVFEDNKTHEPTSIHNVVHEPTFAHNLWHGEPYQSQVSFTNNQQSWDAFEDPTRQLPHIAAHQSGQEVAAPAPFTTVDQHLGAFNQTEFERAASDSRPPITDVPLHVEAHPHVIERQSSNNPFDLSDDFESSNMFFNMNSLQAALPSGHLQSSFVDDVTQSWFTHNPASHYVPSAQQGTLGYMGGPGASAQMPNIATQEPVASVGGNPFA